MMMTTPNMSSVSSFLAVSAAILCTASSGVEGFTAAPARTSFGLANTLSYKQQAHRQSPATSATALNVWWFGGTEDSSAELNQEGDSCELVAVRIEKSSANSRKIAGSITVPTPLEDVWAILTDYNRLSVHVPNLVESRIMGQPQSAGGEMGDGSFRCKLFQKGAQKIIGFEFGASVTMAMTERIVSGAARVSNTIDDESTFAAELPVGGDKERLIDFKCLDSFFFSEFDGEWRAKEQINADGEIETLLDYVVDVRPKGPVPVAALEWRIREDVPTNLRAVKKAATEVGLAGVMATRQPRVAAAQPRAVTPTAVPTPVAAFTKQAPQAQTTNAIRRASIRMPRIANPLLRRNLRQAVEKPVTMMASARQQQQINKAARSANQKKRRIPFKVTWEADETMAAYLGES